jgi:hypothetical protein
MVTTLTHFQAKLTAEVESIVAIMREANERGDQARMIAAEPTLLRLSASAGLLVSIIQALAARSIVSGADERRRLKECLSVASLDMALSSAYREMCSS